MSISDSAFLDRATAEAPQEEALRRDRLSDDAFASIETGEPEKLRGLLAAGANADARNVEGYTLLMAAARAKSVAAVLALIEAGAQVNAGGPAAETALTLAAAQGSEDLARTLITADADYDESTPEEARRHGHHALATSLEQGHLHKLYMEQLKKRALQQKKIDRHDNASHHIGECFEDGDSHAPQAQAHGGVGAGVAGAHWYSKFLGAFSFDIDPAAPRPDTVMGKAVHFAAKVVAPIFGMKP